MPRNPNKTDYSGGFPAGFDAFATIADPRDGGHTLHHFGEILFIAFASLLCGVPPDFFMPSLRLLGICFRGEGR